MEQSPLPAVEPSPENLTQAQEQKARLQVSTGLILGGGRGGDPSRHSAHLPCVFRLSFWFGGEGEAAPRCGNSHILQSRGGGSKKQNKQNRGQGPWGEHSGYAPW